jgi:hypothetical protein
MRTCYTPGQAEKEVKTKGFIEFRRWKMGSRRGRLSMVDVDGCGKRRLKDGRWSMDEGGKVRRWFWDTMEYRR